MQTGDRIKARRQDLGLSVDEVADVLGKNRATVYRYESNAIENFPTSVLEPLSEVLETTPAYLMGWTDDPYNYDIDPDGRIGQIPSEIYQNLVDSCGTDPEDIWKAYTAFQDAVDRDIKIPITNKKAPTTDISAAEEEDGIRLFYEALISMGYLREGDDFTAAQVGVIQGIIQILNSTFPRRYVTCSDTEDAQHIG